MCVNMYTHMCVHVNSRCLFSASLSSCPHLRALTHTHTHTYAPPSPTPNQHTYAAIIRGGGVRDADGSASGRNSEKCCVWRVLLRKCTRANLSLGNHLSSCAQHENSCYRICIENLSLSYHSNSNCRIPFEFKFSAFVIKPSLSPTLSPHSPSRLTHPPTSLTHSPRSPSHLAHPLTLQDHCNPCVTAATHTRTHPNTHTHTHTRTSACAHTHTHSQTHARAHTGCRV